MSFKKIWPIIIVSAPLLSACQSMLDTMGTHYRMGEATIKHIAMGNAGVNVCLANNAINKNIAYAYSTVSAQLLDISVLDNDFYRGWYQDYFNRLTYDKGSIGQGCASLERGLPKVTQDYAGLYMKISNSLAVSRSQEQQEMAAMLRNFGNNWSTSISPITYNWPRVTFTTAEPIQDNYLIKTSNGLLKCRVTNKNFVFCL